MLPEATKIFVMVDDVKEMASKKSCKHGKHGSFEHVPFLFVCLIYLFQTLMYWAISIYDVFSTRSFFLT